MQKQVTISVGELRRVINVETSNSDYKLIKSFDILDLAIGKVYQTKLISIYDVDEEGKYKKVIYNG